MTNAQIIFNAEQELAEQGLIQYTGRTMKATNMAGEEIEIKETEAIHTYQTWKELGYQVQKGQKAIVKLTIWKHSKAKTETVETENGTAQYIDKGRMFLKTASFFSKSQVQGA